jgi:cell division protein FtsI (penicillin-binding protein 3)
MIMSASIDRRSRRRILGIGLVLGVGFAVVAVRAVHLHLTPHGGLEWIAEKQYRAVLPVAQRRGKIVDRKGRDLAVSVPVQSIFADPSAVVNVEAALDSIESVLPLGTHRRVIERRMKPTRKFSWIRRRVRADIADQVKGMAIPGIHFIEESRRIYPNGSLASQLLGAVGYDAEPLAGIELRYNQYLKSTAERVSYRRDARGRTYFAPVDFHSQPDVGTMRTTIDKIIQYNTEQAMDHAMTRTKSVGGIAVVVEVRTGKVLAMVSRPTFDANEYSQYPQDAWRNRAVTDAYEPGSTFKVLVAAAAVDSGIDPTQEFFCERGRIRFGSAVLRDHGASYGDLSLGEIIKVSSNIGAYKIANHVGKTSIETYLRAFGIGEQTGIDFPGEVGGIFRRSAQWQPVEFATIAFGQGVAVSPLQMTMAMAAIANGGALMRPFLVEHISDSSGRTVYSNTSHVVRQVVRPESALQVRQLLREVVLEGGTGTAAASSIYVVAGKTGTAQKVNPGSHGYAKGKYFASFVGFAPLDSPEIAVFVGLDEPHGAYYGGAVAGPVFRKIIDSTLQYLEVPAKGVPVLLARERSALPSRSTGDRVRFEPQQSGRFRMPPLVGLSKRQVLRMVHDVDLPLKVVGQGVVVAQRPVAGSLISRRETVEVSLALPK